MGSGGRAGGSSAPGRLRFGSGTSAGDLLSRVDVPARRGRVPGTDKQEVRTASRSWERGLRRTARGPCRARRATPVVKSGLRGGQRSGFDPGWGSHRCEEDVQVQLEVLEPPESQKNSDRLNRAQRKTASEAPQSSAGKTAQPHLAAAAETGPGGSERRVFDLPLTSRSAVRAVIQRG